MTQAVFDATKNRAFLDACERGDVEAAKLAVEQGAHAFDSGLELACLNGRVDITVWLLDGGARLAKKIFVEVCARGHVNVVHAFVERNQAASRTAVYTAFDRGHYHIVTALLPRNRRAANTVLNAACRRGVRGIVDAAIAQGADAWDDALHSSCRGGHVGLAREMISRGATQFNNALYWACFGGCRDIAFIEMLIERGAPDALALQECLDIIYARENPNIALIALLISRGALLQADAPEETVARVLWHGVPRSSLQHAECAFEIFLGLDLVKQAIDIPAMPDVLVDIVRDYLP